MLVRHASLPPRAKAKLRNTMHVPLAGEPVSTRPDARPLRWRNAFVGLTPQLIAIVAALLVVRSISANVNDIVPAIENGTLGAYLWSVLKGYMHLLAMAVPMLVAIIATANLGPDHGWKRVAALGIAVVLSAGAGSLLRASWVVWYSDRGVDTALSMVRYVWPRYAVLGAMMTAIGEFYRIEVGSVEAAQRTEVDRAAFEREMAGARLQVLQAQIEPHFLFNTLANVRRLYDEDAAAGRTMLEKLMHYLEVALPRMRHDQSRLGHEAELIEAYLHIQRIRMGERLAFSIDIPARLREHRVPPMMLLTLVENAIKHGLNPSPGGGLIRVTARADGDRLVLTVADTGVGFASGSGSGIGLANISARLAAQFGDAAGLSLANNELGGATATIVLPLAAAVDAQ
jgi:signal transduction histidine kinase